MFPTSETARTIARISAGLALLGVILAVAGCGNDNNGGGGTTGLPASTSYVGYVSSTSGVTGSLSITFATAVKAPPASRPEIAGPSLAGSAPVSATGTVVAGGGSISLTGELNGNALTMADGAGIWTLAGTLADGELTGTFTGPGNTAGSLAAVSNTAASPALAFCGSYSGTNLPDTPESGTFSLTVAGAVVLGTSVADDGTSTDFSGTATATTIKVTQVLMEGTLTANGTYDDTGMSGSYMTKAPNGSTVGTGTFSAGICGAVPSVQ